MTDDPFDRLLDAMPKITKAVNVFASPDVQRRVFATRQSRPSAPRWDDTGTRRCAPQPAHTTQLNTDGTHHEAMATARPGILFPPCASTPEPKAGAWCGNLARWDLRGGRRQGRSPPRSTS